MSSAELFSCLEKQSSQKPLMPALVPRTVIMIAEIEQYCPRQAHHEMNLGRASQCVPW